MNFMGNAMGPGEPFHFTGSPTERQSIVQQLTPYMNQSEEISERVIAILKETEFKNTLPELQTLLEELQREDNAA